MRDLILIPAFNEEGRIGALITKIRALEPDLLDILVVNDASADNTAGEAAQAGAIVISHSFNMGYGSTLQTGYKFAEKYNYQYLVQIDADGQHDPEFIGPLLDVVKDKDESVDVCIGSRFLGNSKYKAELPRKIGMILFGGFVSLLIRKSITDPTSGYQAMNRKVIEYFTRDVFPNDYPDADVILLLNRKGFKTKEIPVRMHPAGEGQSIHRGLKPLYYIFKMFLSILVNLIRR